MKKGSLILLTVLLVTLLFVLVSAVSAKPDSAAPIECVLDIAYDEHAPGDFYWLGTVTGCSIEGTVEFRENEAREYYETGNMAHFFEVFTIYPDSGGEIHGFNNGIWNFSNFNFRAQGRVTKASEEWAYLEGSKYHEMGTTGNPEDPLPLEAPDGMMRIVPAK
jgi:hypothetical protein